MTDRRPARSRKAVDYTKFTDTNDFDDDFADLTPPAKKQKIFNKETQKKPVEIKDKKKSTKRAPLSEKVYERELQEALELSLLESQGSTTSGIQDNDDDDFKPKNSKKPSSKTEKTKIEKTKTVTETVNNNHKKNEIVCTVDVIEEKKSDTEICDNVLKNRGNENTEKLDRNDGKSPTDIKKENPKVLSEIQNNKTDGNDSDGIVVLDDETDQVTGRGGRRRSASKVKVTLDESDEDGSDFSVDEADDDSSDDDYDEENDSDFDCRSKRKKAPVNKKASAVRKQTKQTKQIKSVPKKLTATSPESVPGLKAAKPGLGSKGPLSSPAVKSKPSIKSPTCRPNLSSPVVRTVPKWNPPGAVGNTRSLSTAVCMKSPLSGMRVGLSRNQRVKSLHPGLTVKDV